LEGLVVGSMILKWILKEQDVDWIHVPQYRGQ